jgi:hypothetical protein
VIDQARLDCVRRKPNGVDEEEPLWRVARVVLLPQSRQALGSVATRNSKRARG